MSANNFTPFIVSTSSGKLYIGGVPADSARECAESAAGVALLSARPERYGALADALKLNPDIPVYASAAALRSIRQILNMPLNERVIKNGIRIDDYEFRLVSDISWIDSVAVYKNGELILREEPNEYAVRPEREKPLAYIIYASRYGFTKLLADAAAETLKNSYEVVSTNAEAMTEDDIRVMNSADILLVGTHTINRNAPQAVWRAVTSLQPAAMRGTRYLVFGSYGWTGDGIKLINSTLKSMGMCAVCAPTEAVFKPTDEDITRVKKAAALFLEAAD